MKSLLSVLRYQINIFHQGAKAIIIIFLVIFAGIILKLEKVDTCFQVSIYVHPFLRGYVRERSEKVHATLPRVIVGGFKFTVVQRNLK